jgi:hypothetical protein
LEFIKGVPVSKQKPLFDSIESESEQMMSNENERLKSELLAVISTMEQQLQRVQEKRR